jgi:hypothetical protein
VEPSFDEEPRAWFWRLGFDLTFYIVVAVIMLNGAVGLLLLLLIDSEIAPRQWPLCFPFASTS